MEKKRKLVDSEEVPDSETINKKKKKKEKIKKEHEENQEGSLEILNKNDTSINLSQDPDSQETNAKKDKKKKKKSIAQNEEQTSGSPLDSNNPENNDSKGEKLKKKKRKLEESGPNEDTNDIANGTTENVEPENNDTKKEKRKRPKKAKAQNEVQSNNIAENGENKGNTEVESASTPFVEGDGITTPTTKKPPRNTGETKKQYKRRLKGLREAGLLIDPPVVEGVKKDKRNRKTRKEKRDTQAKKNEELERFRSIVQTNYLKMWKNDQSKWKFNKNVQGKLFKHMFDTSRIPQDMFEILIEYIASSKSPNVHTELNKKCSDVIEAMEKWTSASEEEKKKLTEPSSETYERARQVLQSLA